MTPSIYLVTSCTAICIFSVANGFLAVVSSTISHTRCRQVKVTSANSRILASMQKTDLEWKEQLTPEAFNVLRKEGTEPPWSSILNNVKDDGTFACAGCGESLFRTSAKFESGSGWPSFFQPVDSDAIVLETDFKMIVPRTECRCAKCDGHLGHVFNDGPAPTNQRYCMNGVAMSFQSDIDADPELVIQLKNREASSTPVNANPLSILPMVLLYGVISILYASAFFSRYQIAQESSASFPTFPVDYIPLGLSIFCGFLAARDAKRLL